MADEQLKVFVDVVTNRAVSELKKLKKSTEETGQELEDTRTEAQKVADRIDKVTQSMVADMDAASAAADALAQALGPEMSAAIGRAGIMEFVADLKRAGLTAADVEGDADRLAQTLKNIDAAKRPLKDVDDHMKRLGDTADNSRSVFANFTGNAIQELPLMSGAFGPLNMAIGQFAEYATEGNIKLGNFLKTAGAIGAASVAVGLIAGAFENAAAESAALDERSRMLADSLADIVDEMYNLDEIASGNQLDPLSKALTTGDEAAADLVKALGQVGFAAADAASVITDMKNDPKAAIATLAKQFGLTDKLATDLADAMTATGRSGTGLIATFRQNAEAAGYTAAEMDRLMEAIGVVQESARNTALDDLYRQFLNLQVASGGLKQDLVAQAEAMAGLSRDENPQKVYDQYIKLAKAERETADAAAEADKKMKELRSEMGRSALAADSTKLALEQMLGALTDEETWNEIKLNLLGLGERLKELEQDHRQGKTTAEEYWLLVRQEILGAQGDLGGYLTDLDSIPDSMVTELLTSFDPNNVNATIMAIEDLIRRGLTINGRPVGSNEIVGPGGTSQTPTNPTTPGNTATGTTIVVNGALDPVAVADQITRLLNDYNYRNGN